MDFDGGAVGDDNGLNFVFNAEGDMPGLAGALSTPNPRRRMIQTPRRKTRIANKGRSQSRSWFLS